MFLFDLAKKKKKMLGHSCSVVQVDVYSAVAAGAPWPFGAEQLARVRCTQMSVIQTLEDRKWINFG